MTQPITIKGLDKLKKKLSPERYRKTVNAGLMAGALHYKAKIAIYPASPGGRRRESWTPKQRRWFFWALNAGIIDVPYRRGTSPNSERLGQSWTVASRIWHTATVGNDTSYGPFVQDKEKQARYHKRTGWKTTQQVAKTESAAIVGKIENQVERWLDD